MQMAGHLLARNHAALLRMEESLKASRRCNWNRGCLGDSGALAWQDISRGNTHEFRMAALCLAVRCAPGDFAISLLEIGDIRPRSLDDTGGIHAGDKRDGDVSIAIAPPTLWSERAFA
jgi:hypothetical protein